MKALLLGAAEIRDYQKLKSQLDEDYDLVLCVDGGIRHLQPLGLKPDLIVGDLDSAPEQLLAAYKDTPTTTYPREKNESDSELALVTMEEAGYETIHMVGFYGSRWDHTLVNFGLMVKYAHLDIQMLDEGNRAFVGRREMVFEGLEGAVISLIPLTAVKGLTISGVKYPLVDVAVACPTSLTLSNEILEARGTVTSREGTFIVVITSGDA